MKSTLFVTALLASLSVHATTYQGSSFEQVWKQIKSDSYSELPQNKISFRSLYGFLESRIRDSAERTLSDRSDLLPQFQKLAHPNGVCLAGTWEITEENPYGGYYKKGSKGLIIARASTAMSATKQGKNRAFGFAGKIFPTLNEGQTVPTSNFFLVDDLGGTKAPHYTGVEMLNEPAISTTTTVVFNLLYALKLAATFGKADSNPNMRQLYEVSYIGETEKNKVRTPKWMKVGATPGQTIDEADFRDELSIDNNGGELSFDISVASTQDDEGNKNWSKIGTIRFTDSAASNSCDHRLHFHHPKWKSNLKH
ncbi:MAG: hypothetical protein EP319_18665 [Deltaproteobacteria bacterium]|nr:MAG: hypothetical protein EP319_18665 [Deltaproteobacteria bacterium]